MKKELIIINDDDNNNNNDDDDSNNNNVKSLKVTQSKRKSLRSRPKQSRQVQMLTKLEKKWTHAICAYISVFIYCRYYVYITGVNVLAFPFSFSISTSEIT